MAYLKYRLNSFFLLVLPPFSFPTFRYYLKGRLWGGRTQSMSQCFHIICFLNAYALGKREIYCIKYNFVRNYNQVWFTSKTAGKDSQNWVKGNEETLRD